MRPFLPRVAPLTWAVAAITAAATALGLLVPGFTAALVRSPAFFTGEWWRLLSPVLVNPEGRHQVVFNLVMLVVVGQVAERVYGRGAWVLLYVTGALAGEIYCYATGSYSAGTSVAIAGLLGGLIAWVALGHAKVARPPRAVAVLAVVGALLLAVLGDEHGAPILAGTLLGVALLRLAPRRSRTIPTAHDLRRPPSHHGPGSGPGSGSGQADLSL